MREIEAKKITEAIKNLCIEASTNLAEDIEVALNKALKDEESPRGREILRQILENAKIARKEKLPICQDTGGAVVFIELGQEVRIINGTLEEAINEGVSLGYQKGFLRKSIVSDPLKRKNTGDNTPAMIHLEMVAGDKIKITLLAKGGGAENKSAIKMFNPSSTKEEISAFIVETVEKAGPDACPPYIIGVGIGGTFDKVAVLAKKSLLRPIGKHHSSKNIAEWEKELLERINKLGIGPMGLGGKITALAVNIETYPCHISSLPVAVNMECHAHRVKSAVI